MGKHKIDRFYGGIKLAIKEAYRTYAVLKEVHFYYVFDG